MKAYLGRPAAILLGLLIGLNVSLFLAHYHVGAITWNRWIFLWFLASLTDLVAATMAVVHAWRYRRNRLVLYYNGLLIGIVVEGICAVLANISPPAITDYTVWYSCWIWSGRWVKSFAVWMLVLYQIGLANGREKAPI